MAELGIPHVTQEDLVSFYFGEAGTDDVVLHLDSCAVCRHEFETLKSSLAIVKTLAVPEPPAEFEGLLWRRLQVQETGLQRRPGWWRTLRVGPKLGLAALAAGLATVAFFAGRLTLQPTPPPTQLGDGSTPALVRERLLVAALSDHLEQSERILIEINNQALGHEQERAENMLAANRLYRQCAAQQGNTVLLATLDDLERILLDVAHAPQEWSPQQLRNLRDRINGQGLLFKVKVLSSRMRDLNGQPQSRQLRTVSTSNSLKGL